MALRSRNKVSANFNMSSMTDIVFLLLIFFMLTSTLVSPNALKLLLPNSTAKTLEKQTISISITPEIDFYINENKVNKNSIEQELKLLIGNDKEPAIILHADKTVDIEHVVKVLNIAYNNKYKIVLATKPN
jgi:biopolymer transport protein ExbD